MPFSDVFDSDAFSMASLTAAMEKVPHRPQLLGSLNIFDPRPVPTTKVAIEKRDNVLSLIQTSERGAPLTEHVNTKRDIRDFDTVRIAKGDTLYAQELQDVRAMGSESELQNVMSESLRRMERIRDDIELTWENMRLGAVQGIVTDADASTINNWYTDWGIAQPAEVDFALSTSTTKIRPICQDVIRAMQRAAKGAWSELTTVHALCGDDFFDALIDHDNVRGTFQNWASAQDLRENKSFRVFPYGGIFFHNYRGTDDMTTVAVAADKAKFFPVGATGVFQVAYSPGEFFDSVNSPGQDIYAISIPDRERNAWLRLEAYSYPLFICTRPEMLQRGTA